MTLRELCIILVVVVTIIILTTYIVYKYMMQFEVKSKREIKDVYLGGLENSDNSIREAMKHLKLTNGIENQKGKS